MCAYGGCLVFLSLTISVRINFTPQIFSNPKKVRTFEVAISFVVVAL